MTAVSGSTNVLTELGDLTIGQLAALHPVEFDAQDYKGPKIFLENASLHTPKLFFMEKPTNLFEIRLQNSVTLKCQPTQYVLTQQGFVWAKNLKPNQLIGCVPTFFVNICRIPNSTNPVVDITKHKNYMQNNVLWVPIAGRTTVPIVEPSFNFGLPPYNRFVGNSIILRN
jgi:hypothetical protein